jgi:hypothetical protein
MPRAGDGSASLFRRLGEASIQALKFPGDGEWQSRLNAKIDAVVKRAISDATVKTTAQGRPDVSGDPWFLTRVLSTLHTRLPVHWAPGLPCALVIC